ncbi:MAG: DNA-processing protein DprA [Clostridiales bacterium]|jgi:DNA processing protein|nr:DNA-processing protein DprA [Clostridiales bacterium]
MADKYELWFSHLYDVSFYVRFRLLEYFGSAEEVFKHGALHIDNVKNIPAEAKCKITRIKSCIIPEKLEEYIQLNDINVIGISDSLYPELLKNIENPPFLLYYKGKIPEAEQLWINIIGARRCSEYGRSVAFRLSGDLARKGAVVVSGMARGLDSQAHLGALDGQGKTVAVLAGGVDMCYPPENRDLYQSIIGNGCVMSECPPKTEVKPWMFPVRNRILSGLCRGTLVVEADIKSGTMITVDSALNQGREVFAVPGNITSRFSTGTNALIKDGAHVVRSAEDVLDVFGTYLEEPENAEEEMLEGLEPGEIAVYKIITYEPESVENIQLISGLEYRQLQFVLTNLELKGRIKKLPGQRYAR